LGDTAFIQNAGQVDKGGIAWAHGKKEKWFLEKNFS
jgi:hypothetical protein